MLDLCTQCSKGGSSRKHILTLQQAGYGRLAQGQGAEHQGAMRNRLVARGAHAPHQPVDGTGNQLDRGGFGGQGTLSTTGVDDATRRPPTMPEFAFDRVKGA
jgi:hypothetical protein